MSSAIDLMVRLERRGAPLHAQLEEQLRGAVRSGRLAPGVALPSTRVLARDLGVSRGVVVDAYAQLAAEGYLLARQGAPTRVTHAASAADGALRAAAEERPPRFDFRPGGPDVSLFPRAAWLASLRRALRDAPDARLDYGDPRGAPELRGALARYLGRVRGVACAAERVVVTSGMAQGMAIFGRALLADGGRRRIGVEDPSSAPGRAQLAATGLEIVPVPVDADGLVVEPLERSALDAALVTPAHQFPTGSSSPRIGGQRWSIGRLAAARSCWRTTTTPSTATTGCRWAPCRGSGPSTWRMPARSARRSLPASGSAGSWCPTGSPTQSRRPRPATTWARRSSSSSRWLTSSSAASSTATCVARARCTAPAATPSWRRWRATCRAQGRPA